MAEHTPTPWKDAHFEVRDTSGHDMSIARMGIVSGASTRGGRIESFGIDDDQALANAAFIVKAVNSHETLVKALGDLLEANKTLASLSPFHHNRGAAIAGQEVAERAARDLIAAVVGTVQVSGGDNG